jgi:hypothetical protein
MLVMMILVIHMRTFHLADDQLEFATTTRKVNALEVIVADLVTVMPEEGEGVLTMQAEVAIITAVVHVKLAFVIIFRKALVIVAMLADTTTKVQMVQQVLVVVAEARRSVSNTSEVNVQEEVLAAICMLMKFLLIKLPRCYVGLFCSPLLRF